jgi:hypothetical protein
MMSVFQVFKMVFGVIASALILYFLITYAGSYGKSQEEGIHAAIMKDLRTDMGEVFVKGNPLDMDLGKLGKDTYFDGSNTIPVIKFDNMQLEFTEPMLFRFGSMVAVAYGDANYGWWDFRMVEVVPAMTFVFSPTDGNDDTWDAMKMVAQVLPDTRATNTKASYAFCFTDGITPQPGVDYYIFNSMLLADRSGIMLGDCPTLMQPNQELVIFSGDCSNSNYLCVEAANRRFHMPGTAGYYYYIDGFDIAAALIGGTQTDLHGNAGENLYLYKQKIFRSSALLAAEVAKRRALNLSGQLLNLVLSGQLEADSSPAQCIAEYTQLNATLSGVEGVLADENYFREGDTMGKLAGLLSETRGIYGSLAQNGCEVPKW